MKRHLRPLAPVVIFLALCVHLGAQSEPDAMPVRPVGSEPERAPVNQPEVAPTPPAPSPRVAVDDSKARIEKLMADITRLAEDLAKERAAHAKTRSELAATRTEAGRAKNEVKDSHDRYAAERDELAAEVATLKGEKERLENARDQTRVDLASAKARLEVLETSIREGAPVDATSLREALRESQARVDMTVRAFAIIEQENNRIRSQLSGSDPRSFKSDLEAAERALADAQNDLEAEKIRSSNLARELSRARPGTPLVIDATSGLVAPTRPSAVPMNRPDTAGPDTEVKIHTVADGENLSVISKRYYGNAGRWMEIFNANRDIMQNENSLAPGMKLRIPGAVDGQSAQQPQ
jgi:nucleoid-associated protein YgaU